MDPDATLAAIRALRGTTDPAELAELANLVHSLDDWLTLGGFLPRAWRQGIG